jgi:hypothetical protein
MSIRGETTEAIRRQGEQRVREELGFDEDSDYPSNDPVGPPAYTRHPDTLFEPEAWRARFGVRCGGPSPEMKNP